MEPETTPTQHREVRLPKSRMVAVIPPLTYRNLISAFKRNNNNDRNAARWLILNYARLRHAAGELLPITPAEFSELHFLDSRELRAAIVEAKPPVRAALGEHTVALPSSGRIVQFEPDIKEKHIEAANKWTQEYMEIPGYVAEITMQFWDEETKTFRAWTVDEIWDNLDVTDGLAIQSLITDGFEDDDSKNDNARRVATAAQNEIVPSAVASAESHSDSPENTSSHSSITDSRGRKSAK